MKLGDIEDTLDPKNLTKSTSKASRRRNLTKEKNEMLLEAAAIAWVQMENGEYRYRPGTYRQYDEDGNPKPNKSEIMRVAGYSEKSVEHFEEYVGKQEKFWQLVELYRIRANDPNFARNREKDLWSKIGDASLRSIYEAVMYYPHSLSITEHLKIVDMILKAGLVPNVSGTSEEKESKTAKLLETVSSEKRAKIMSDYESSLKKELEELEKLRMAHEAADG